MDIQNICKDKKRDVNLVKANLRHDNSGYYLDLVYRVEDDKTVELYKLPRVRLPLKENDVTIRTDHDGFSYISHANVGFGYLRLHPDKNGVQYTVETIETKTKEMTLEEIEKKLGHKVKIVSEKEES